MGAAVSESTNRVYVTKYSGDSVTVIEDTAPPPANDDFTDAATISGITGTIAGTNVGATTEVGEPSPWEPARAELRSGTRG